MAYRKTETAFIAFLALMMAGGAGWYFLIEPWRQTSKLFGGSAGRQTLSQPDSVQAFRVGNLIGFNPALTDQIVIAGPQDVPRELWPQIEKALEAPDAFRWSAKACEPQYDVRLSFQRGDDQVDVLLCFFCNTLLAYRNGQLRGEKDFDDVRDQLLTAIQAAFPDDETIQSLSR